MKFNCGCQYEKLDFNNIPLQCSATWNLISNGYTKGVFQLEKPLGKRWSKKIKPTKIEELSDVISIIRPGPLKGEYVEDPQTPGKYLTIADTYIKVRDGEMAAEYPHESFAAIFKNTYGTPIYQEQIMKVCTEFAGFTLIEADDMRKAIGKKNTSEMKRMGTKFIESSQKMGHTQELAERIFKWIDKFSSYSFNQSHGIGYAMLAYWTAYAKVHFPLEYFKAMLANSDGKQDSDTEVKELINEAKIASMWSGVNVQITPPSLLHRNKDFETTSDSSIVFGISHIKGVGDKAAANILALPETDHWQTMLSNILKSKVDKGSVEALIKSGALDYIKLPNRVTKLKDYRTLYSLTDREVAHVIEQPDVASGVKSLLESKIPNKARKPRIEEAIKLIDKELSVHPTHLNIAWEKALLGISLSGSETELYRNKEVDTTCKQFLKLKNGSFVSIGAVIDDIRTHKDKNNNTMAFLKASDHTYMLDNIVMFSRVYMTNSWILDVGKPVLINGRKDNDSLIILSIQHL